MSINVTSGADSGPGSFRAAIEAVNTLLASTINFTGTYTITLASALPTIIAASITINGANSTVDGNGQFYCLIVSPVGPSSIAINLLTFTNGFNTNDNAGLRINNSTATLTDVNVTNCNANYDSGFSFGVGLSLISCNTTITGNSAITGNIANLQAALAADMFVGIGIYVNGGSINATGTSISNNSYTTTTAFASLSGGIHIQDTFLDTFTSCIINANTSKSNAGIYIQASAVNFIDTVITNNIATATGGGIGAIGSTIRLDSTVNNALSISTNTAATQGGGIFSNGSTLQSAADTQSILIQGNILNSLLVFVEVNGVGVYGNDTIVDIENISIDGNLNQSASLNVPGGGMYLGGSASGNRINNCRFTNNSAIDGGGLYSALTEVITITNSLFDTNMAEDNGGGINCKPILYGGLTIINNVAARGGGIYLSADQPTQSIINALPSIISENTASGFGGAIYCGSNATSLFDNITIQNNTASVGGGLYLTNGINTISNCFINSNTVTNAGGGIICDGGTININNSIISNNSATNSGGGLRTNGTTNITNTIIQSNTAANGANVNIAVLNPVVNITNSNIINGIVTIPTNTGGILKSTGTLNLSYCNISGNAGNGIESIGTLPVTIANSNIANNNVGITSTSPLTISNSTIGNNITTGIINNNGTNTTNLTNVTIARNATGIINTSGTVSIVNTIIGLNTTADATGTFNSLGYNLVQNTAGSIGFTQPTDITGVNPLLDVYAPNGGPTETMALLPESPALDNGNTDAVVGLYDQRGPGFNRVINASVDIGAFESQAVVCFIGSSLLLVKDIITGIICEIKACDITSDKYHIYDCIKKIFVPIIYNIVTYNQNRFVKLAAGLIEGKPSVDTYLTSGHHVLVDGHYIKARRVPGKQIVYLDYQNIYTICLKNAGSILLNGIPVKAYGLDEWNTYVKAKNIRWHNNGKMQLMQ